MKKRATKQSMGNRGQQLNGLRDLLVDELGDLLYAENLLVKTLPKVIEASSSPELKEAIESHLEETRGHVSRLEQAFERLGETAKAVKCKGMTGILEEGAEALEKDGEDAVVDAGIIGAAQRVEHYEIAGYGCARSHAEQIGETEVAELLEQTLDEEKKANNKLTAIAKEVVNVQAQGQSA